MPSEQASTRGQVRDQLRRTLDVLLVDAQKRTLATGDDPPVPARAALDEIRGRIEAAEYPKTAQPALRLLLAHVDDLYTLVDRWWNVPVVTVRDLGEALEAAFSQPLPELTENEAEITCVDGPAIVTVIGQCGFCGVAIDHQLTEIDIETVKHGRGGTTETKAKAKTKARVHTCGQLPLPVARSNGQAKGQLVAFTGGQAGGSASAPADATDAVELEGVDAEVGGDAVTIEGSSDPDAPRMPDVEDEDEDLRPTGEVNPDALAGEAKRSIFEEADESDLLPL